MDEILGIMSKFWSGRGLLPRSSLLSLTEVQQHGARWVVSANGPAQAACPACGCVSTSHHSAYVRTLKDLPAVGATVSLHIRVARWRCRTRACAVRVFADRLPGVAEVRGRRTCRANAIARLIGCALGGRAGERLAERLGLPISNDSHLRRVKTGAQPAVSSAQVIGIDEWATRKGRTYGTIVVDLERHTVVDVLDQHSSEAVEHWLAAHPDVQTICRDRNGRYARAARVAAPTASQVTDPLPPGPEPARDHRARTGLAPRLSARAGQRNGRPDHPPLVPSIDRPVCSPVARERRLLPARRLALQTEIRRQLRQTHQQLFDTFKTLQATGVSISAIAQQLGCNRRRLDKWATQSQLPARQKMHPSPGSAETFREFLRQRWDAGCRHGRALLDELRARGYQGTCKAVGKIVSPWRVGNVVFERAADDVTMPPRPRPCSPTPPNARSRRRLRRAS